MTPRTLEQANLLIKKQSEIITAARAMHCTDGKVTGICGSICSDKQIKVCTMINKLEEETRNEM